jgi:hypothetical protein
MLSVQPFSTVWHSDDIFHEDHNGKFIVDVVRCLSLLEDGHRSTFIPRPINHQTTSKQDVRLFPTLTQVLILVLMLMARFSYSQSDRNTQYANNTKCDLMKHFQLVIFIKMATMDYGENVVG